MATIRLQSIRRIIRSLGWRVCAQALLYNMTAFVRNRRCGIRSPRGDFQLLGRVASLDPQPRGALVHAEHGHIEITFLSPEIIRVRMSKSGDFSPPFSYAVDKIDWPDLAITCDDGLDVLAIHSGQVTCRVQKTDCRLTVETADGRILCQDAPGLAFRDRQVRWTRQLPDDERCYALGQRASAMNLRGKRLALWCANPHGYNRDDDPVYASIPFYLGVRPGISCGVLWDNPAHGYVDLGAENAEQMTFLAEDGELRFYFFSGRDIQTILKHYTELTGRMPLPPMWALGYHQSRWGYDSEDAYRALAAEFRERNLPCDALHFDITYMDGCRCFTWDRARFPLMPTLLADLDRQGFKAVAILDPGIKIDSNYPVYQDGVQHDVFLKYPDDARVTAPVWSGNCHFPDFTSARVRAWWGSHLSALTQAGFAGIWDDKNEPAVIALRRWASLPVCVVYDWDGAGKTHIQGGNNVYGMQMARATRDGLLKLRPGKRPFVITRSLTAGAQRYASFWTGDNAATWDHLRLSISMVLNMGLSGVAFTGADVGGFAGEPDGELFARWMQVGSMLPFFRVHTALGTAPQDPWSYGERIEAIAREYLELRYQLLPYIYSTFAQCAQDGIPIVRPLFMVDPYDRKLRDIEDEFMLGDTILVAPILEPSVVKRDVYLPDGMWYEHATGRLLNGAQTVTAAAPLEQLPLYFRAGKVVPMWPVMQYVGEKRLDTVRLRVYAGTEDTTIYEDAGEGMEYQHGAYRWLYFTCRTLPTRELIIEWRRAGQYQPPYDQVHIEVVGIPSEPERVMLDDQSAPIWYYENEIVELVVKPFDEVRIVGCTPPASQASTLIRPPGE